MVVQLPCSDSDQIISRLRRDSGGTWSISTIFWTRTIDEYRVNEEGENLNEPKTKVG